MADPKIVSKGRTTCACGQGCNCGCGYRYWSAWRVLKWLIGILILFIVFFIGVKAGEFHAELQSMMYGNYYRHPMMMNQQGGAGFVPPTATSTPVPVATGTAGTPTAE